MSKPKSPVGKLPSQRIQEILDAMAPKGKVYFMQLNAGELAIMRYLDEQSNLKHEEGK